MYYYNHTLCLLTLVNALWTNMIKQLTTLFYKLTLTEINKQCTDVLFIVGYVS